MFDASDTAALLTLDALLREVSVTRAARRLGLSTPAVSHALARLRERFNDPLLVRAGREMVLTPRAEALRPVVRDAIEATARVFEPPREFTPGDLKRLFTLSVTDYVLLVYGVELDRVLSQHAPGIALRYIPNSFDDDLKIRTGETDLAIGIYGDLPPEFKTRPVITDRLVCVVRADHPDVRHRLSLDQYLALEHIQIAPRGRPGGYVDEVLAHSGVSRNVSRVVPYFHVGLALAAASDRVLTVSHRIAEASASALGLKIFEAPLPLEPFSLSMVWHPRFDADPAHAWLREHIVAVTRTLEASSTHARKRLSRKDPTAKRRR